MNILAQTAFTGLICGDAFGAPFEYNPDAFKYAKQSAEEKRYLDLVKDCDGKISRWRQPGLHTDDAQQALILLNNIDNPVQGFKHGSWFLNYNKAHRGTGRNFRQFLQGSIPTTAGLGAAMRIGPASLCFPTLEEALRFAHDISSLTTNDPLGTASAMWLVHKVWLLANRHPSTWIYKLIESYDEKIKDAFADHDKAYDAWFDSGVVALLQVAQPLTTHKLTSPTTGFGLTGVVWAFAKAVSAPDYLTGLTNACEYGGDTDTICAITGCLLALNQHKAPKWMINQLVGNAFAEDYTLWTPEWEVQTTAYEDSCRTELWNKVLEEPNTNTMETK